MLKRPQTLASPVPAKKQKTDSEIVDGLRCYYTEKELPLQEGQIMFSIDKKGGKGAKMFCSSTWPEIYSKIRCGYITKRYKPYYEPVVVLVVVIKNYHPYDYVVRINSVI